MNEQVLDGLSMAERHILGVLRRSAKVRYEDLRDFRLGGKEDMRDIATKSYRFNTAIYIFTDVNFTSNRRGLSDNSLFFVSRNFNSLIFKECISL